MNPNCPDCGDATKRRNGKYGPFYSCVRYPRCKGIVSCDKNGKIDCLPGNYDTRRHRTKAHKLFDYLWRESKITRGTAYVWLRKVTGLPREKAHIRYFNLEQCKALIKLLEEVLGMTTSYQKDVEASKDINDGPHGWIQWKGTNVCIDLYCECGYHGHVDDMFLYYYRCPKCKQYYIVSCHVRLIPCDEKDISHNTCKSDDPNLDYYKNIHDHASLRKAPEGAWVMRMVDGKIEVEKS